MFVVVGWLDLNIYIYLRLCVEQTPISTQRFALCRTCSFSQGLDHHSWAFFGKLKLQLISLIHFDLDLDLDLDLDWFREIVFPYFLKIFFYI